MGNIDNLKPFEKGKSGNPAGKKKGTLNAKTVIEKWLKVKEKIKHPITGEEVRLTQMDIITLAQVKEARSGNTQAYNALMDRKEGKPKQIQEVTGADGKDFIPPGGMRVVIENPHNDSTGE